MFLRGTLDTKGMVKCHVNIMRTHHALTHMYPLIRCIVNNINISIYIYIYACIYVCVGGWLFEGGWLKQI